MLPAAATTTGEPVNRPDEARRVEDVQPAWIDGVAGEEDPAIAVVVGDGSLTRPGSCQAIENPAAEIDFGPPTQFFVGEAEVRPRSVALGADYHGVGPACELAVSGGVVGMRMRMEDEMPMSPGRRVAGEPAVDDRVHGATQGKPGIPRSAGVDQECSGASEEEKHERRLVMDSHVLAQDVGVLVIGWTWMSGSVLYLEASEP